MINVLPVIYVFAIALFCKIAWLDYKTHTIDDKDTLILLGLVFAAAVATKNYLNFFVGGVVGLCVNTILFFLSRWWHKRETYGAGDVLLHGVIGAYFGPIDYCNYYVFSTLLTACLILLFVIFKKAHWSTEFPLAPALLISIVFFEILV